MSLDIALGNDLPRIWYESVTGTRLRPSAPRRRRPAFWHDAVSSDVGFAVRFLRGPERQVIVGHALWRFAARGDGHRRVLRSTLDDVLVPSTVDRAPGR